MGQKAVFKSVCDNLRLLNDLRYKRVGLDAGILKEIEENTLDLIYTEIEFNPEILTYQDEEGQNISYISLLLGLYEEAENFVKVSVDKFPETARQKDDTGRTIAMLAAQILSIVTLPKDEMKAKSLASIISETIKDVESLSVDGFGGTILDQLKYYEKKLRMSERMDSSAGELRKIYISLIDEANNVLSQNNTENV